MRLLLHFIFSAFCLNTIGQVYNAGTQFSNYYDIAPDSLLHYTVYPYTNQSFGLKLFGAASNNIQFYANGAASPGGTSANISVKSLDQNISLRFGRWDSTYIPAYTYWDVSRVAQPLNMNDPINGTGAIWDTSLLDLSNHKSWGGGTKNDNDWVGADKYIGLKYQYLTILQYGWIRVQCPSADSCYVKDYSYTSPVQTNVKELTSQKLTIFPNPANTVFYIQAENTGNLKIEILDLLGNKINFIPEAHPGQVKIQLDANLPNGYYLVQCSIGNDFAVGRLVKGGE